MSLTSLLFRAGLEALIYNLSNTYGTTISQPSYITVNLLSSAPSITYSHIYFLLSGLFGAIFYQITSACYLTSTIQININCAFTLFLECYCNTVAPCRLKCNRVSILDFLKAISKLSLLIRNMFLLKQLCLLLVACFRDLNPLDSSSTKNTAFLLIFVCLHFVVALIFTFFTNY